MSGEGERDDAPARTPPLKRERPKVEPRSRTGADDESDAPIDATDTKAVPGGDEQFDPADPRLYFNRERSELAFQRRVLHEAEDERTPLLDRVKFCSILTTNLDEFVMKRVGGLKQQIAADVTEPTADGMTPKEQWESVLEESHELLERQWDLFHGDLRGRLADEGIHVLDHGDLSADEQTDMREYFEASILPTLTPLTFDPAHPFPFISNRSLSLGVLTREDEDDEPTFSRVKIPRNRPRFVELADGRYLPIEELIVANLDLLFPDVEIVDHTLFRVTRNAEVRRNEEVAEDLIERIEAVLRERRFATVVRLEIDADAPEAVRELLVDQLDLDEREVVDVEGLHDGRDLMELADIDRPDLSREPWTPQPHPRLSDGRHDDVFGAIRDDDVLVHHPYHSFDETVHRFIDEAANDPDVLAIKAAIYRTAADSKIIDSLIEAAHNGKQVAVMVELKARFDEAANLEWVETLEEEGIHVAYGTIDYKAHTKTTLVVREEDDGVQLYSHVGTGNYHSETAKTYTDLGLLTADEDLGQDLVKLFNYFTGHSLPDDYRELLVAPENLRHAVAEKVRREAEIAADGGDARIVAKLNRLEDPALVRELYRASSAGVDVDLIVRDICRLRPGIEGLSETISVRSIVGRFLEHSRVYYFRNAGDPEYYVGSADWMVRNLDNRVEAVAPIEDEALRAELDEILRINLADNRLAWELQPDGTYVQCRPGDDAVCDTHQSLMARTREQARAAAATRNRPDGDAEPEIPDVPPSSSPSRDSGPEGGCGVADPAAAGDRDDGDSSEFTAEMLWQSSSDHQQDFNSDAEPTTAEGSDGSESD
ncbi:polyphosphate kinase 1 [Salinarchaeum laminariae]|uniref:polyphosphate kinase 1 n=1 Tax=Salinarchaeum laminariae TaxID=869888 RepID=UPI0020BF4EBC|nr:polyphosphate kinase 1 [Salinarchaeum laminariae]